MYMYRSSQCKNTRFCKVFCFMLLTVSAGQPTAVATCCLSSPSVSAASMQLSRVWAGQIL